MKLFTKITISFLVVLSLISIILFYKSLTSNNEYKKTWQEVQELLRNGDVSYNSEPIIQAENKLSLWLDNNKDSNDKETLAKFLYQRANVYIVLGKPNKAIYDLEKAIQYDPIGENQLGICFMKKQLSINSYDLQDCYLKAVEIFRLKNTSLSNPNYLISLILSGDKSAITKYKNLISSTKNIYIKENYIIAIKSYLNKEDCLEILEICEDD
ncbi:Tetratricopeptide repeat protein [Aliarcobacter thereius]|uniref:Tetratricopeptide repeat protein n=1 Tax=Aliarcobacter thereius TaxID=544718 RepID=A0A1C0B240_9BACT|nr:tetratricopeptide repeat protein [Aliarcobacter thereius]OCL85352.1 Tetratricopeptide repeat protein [Aliarcobacter thereius]OCL94435.1 Tetratricopeptide repeat protein [Aliarcobacter thereius]